MNWAKQVPFTELAGTLALTFPTYCWGDCNQNGVVDVLNIAPMIEILTNGPYLAQADCNQDGEVSFLDLGQFIAILAGN